MSVPRAFFTASVVSGSFPLTVDFTDQSTNSPTSWEWDFNYDGIVDSTSQNPSYTYNSPGVYTVRLKVSNSSGSDAEIKFRHITVTEPPVSVSLKITTGEIYTESYAMDVNYTVVGSTGTEYTVTKYIAIPKTTSTSVVVINGTTQTVTVTNFITGTELTNYLTSIAPVEDLLKATKVQDQVSYLNSYTGTTVLTLT